VIFMQNNKAAAIKHPMLEMSREVSINGLFEK